MPFVVLAQRVKGRWVVQRCPGCQRSHRHRQVGALVSAPCGASYLVLAPGRPVGIRSPRRDAG